MVNIPPLRHDFLFGRGFRSWNRLFPNDFSGMDGWMDVMATLNRQRSEEKQRLVRVVVNEQCHLQEAFCAFRCRSIFVCTKQLVTHTHTHKRRSFDHISTVNGVRKFLLKPTISRWSPSCDHGGHGGDGTRTESEHLRRWFSNRSSHADKHRSRIEDNAPWKETWRSNRA